MGPHPSKHRILPRLFAFARCIAVLLVAILLAGCATDPNEPGAGNWYLQRLQEIEAARAAGQITEAEYLTLKGQADATRASRINAERYSYPNEFFGPGDD